MAFPTREQRRHPSGGWALVAAALLLAGCNQASPRILLLGFDGLDPVALDTFLAEGRLPNFARLRREGAYGRLRSFEPMLSPILWTTIATGKTPDQHGIGHFMAVDPRTGDDLPVTSDLRRVKALWNLFSERGRTVAVVGWWATWPPEEVLGSLISDHVAYHFLFGDGFAPDAATLRGPASTTWPAELEGRIRPAIVRPQAIGRVELAPFADVDEAELARPLDLQDDLWHLRWLLATTATYRNVGLRLWDEERPDLEMVYFEGTDSIAHLFGHLFREPELAGELAAQQARYGRAVEAMYERADEILGDFLAAQDRATTLVVLSDHGFRLGELPDDPSRLRDMRRVSERYHREHGVLYLYGRKVRPGARIDGATLLDIAPTVLASAGLPPGADMPGRVLVEAFAGPLAAERIATWEASGEERAPGPRDEVADRMLRERLQSLGYLAGSERGETAGQAAIPSRPNLSNLAAIAFGQGRYEEAERIYRELAAEDPGDAAARTSLAGVLGARGQYEAAMRELDAAIRLDPLNAEAYHNRGALLERLGQRPEAVEEYRTALRYQPDYEPSQRALRRLTGEASARQLGSPAEARAAGLCELAAAAARRGDYGEAYARLETAKQAAPGFVLVWQYESNVAYLAGDSERAIAALEHALTIEPGNALFRSNLERLRRQQAPD